MKLNAFEATDKTTSRDIANTPRQQTKGNVICILSCILLGMLCTISLPVSVVPYLMPDIFLSFGILQEISLLAWTGIEWFLILCGLGLSAPAWLGGAKDLLQLHPTSRGLYICTLGNLTLLAAFFTVHRLSADAPMDQLLPTAVITLYTFLIRLGNAFEPASDTDAISPSSSASHHMMQTMRSFAARFIAFSILLSLAAALCWYTIGSIHLRETISLFFALSALATPAAFPLALPIAYAAFRRVTKRHHIEIKSPRLFESLADVSVVVYDRCGTVTEGRPFLSQIITEGLSDSTLIGLAASLENGEEHPLSPVIMHAAVERKARLSRISAKNSFSGFGIEAIIAARPIRLGKRTWLDEEGVSTSASLITQGDQAAAKGKICVYLATDKSTKGILVFTDELRHDTRRAVHHLDKLGIASLLLTGESKQTAKRLARDAGISSARADLSPADKAREIQLLTTRGHVCLMVASGDSDMQALQAADISVQCKHDLHRTPRFIPDVVLHSNATTDLLKLITLGRAARKNLRVGLITAFLVQILVYLTTNVELSTTNTMTFYPMYLFIGSIIGIALCSMQILRLLYLKLPAPAIDR